MWSDVDWGGIPLEIASLLERFCIRYAVIVILLVIVYKLGFARRLPLLKSAIVYLLLAIGCFPLVILSYGLPIMESLVIALLFLLLVRYRQARYRPPEQRRNPGGSTR